MQGNVINKSRMRRFYIVVILITLIFFVSCGYTYYCSRWIRLEKSRQVCPYTISIKIDKVYDFFEKGFIVDTIRFVNPIIVNYYDYCFICEDKVLQSDKNIVENYLAPDVYSYDFDNIDYLHFKDMFNIPARPSSILVEDTTMKQTKFVKFYRFKKNPDYYILVLLPMQKCMNSCYLERLCMNYRKWYLAYKKASTPKILNAYMRHIICVWK